MKPGRTEVAVLSDSYLFTGLPLDTHYIEALSFVVLCSGAITFEIHGGELPDNMTLITPIPLIGNQTIQVDVSQLPRFIKPVIRRDNPAIPTAFFIDMTLAPQPASFGMDTLDTWLSK